VIVREEKAPAAPLQAITDEELVRRIREGETGLFELVMRRYNQRLYRAARAIVKDDSLAEDVMQEAYLQAFALPGALRAAYVLRDVEGMSTAEAAECLEISEDALKTRLSRARALLRDELYARAGAAACEAFSFHASRCDRVTAAVLERIAAGR